MTGFAKFIPCVLAFLALAREVEKLADPEEKTTIDDTTIDFLELLANQLASFGK